MSPSLRALLTDILDYAGLFPPASLSLDESIWNYARYRTSDESWMLSRFICPAARLVELDPYPDELFPPGDPFQFSVLGRGGNDAREFIAGLRNDLSDMATFGEQRGDGVVVDAFEVRVPGALVEGGESGPIQSLLDSTAELIDRKGPPALRPAFEVSLVGDWHRAVTAAAAALADHNRSRPENGSGRADGARSGQAMFKLRCGGVTSDAFPSPEQVAVVITTCRDARVPLKFTAGLHHPVRHFNRSVGTKMHGFLNVFGAGVLAWAHDLDAAAIQQILEIEDAKAFTFDGDGFAVAGHSLDIDGIAAARDAFATSYGSCSFDEPREDLRALGLM